MKILFRCELPDGTPWVSVADIPRLLARATNPPSANDRIGSSMPPHAAEAAHRNKLRKSILAGEVHTYDPIKLVPYDPQDGTVPTAIVLVKHLKEYAATFHVEIVVKPDPKHVALEEQQAQMAVNRRWEGRYQLEEAARTLADATNNPLPQLLKSLFAAALSNKFPVYRPRETIRALYERGSLERVREDYEEVYWSDLNEWLKVATKISWRFPDPPSLPTTVAPGSENAPTVLTTKTRRRKGDTLTPVLVEITDRVGFDTPLVWRELEALATQRASPLTKKLGAKKLAFLNTEGVERSLTYKAVSNRLSRMTSGANSAQRGQKHPAKSRNSPRRPE